MAGEQVAVKVGGGVTEYATDAFIANAGTSPKLIYDATGALVWSPHNLFVNSATPATQDVTLITGATYTVTVTGTGSLAGSSGASGTASAGSPATFTATGTTGTFTLTGALTTIQLNRGSVATAYLATGAAARFGIALDFDPATLAALGLLCEQVATNLLLNNETLSTQNVTVTAVAHTLSFWGTGTITLSGASTAGPLVGTGANNRVTLTFTPTAGTLTLTVSGTVTKAQLETGAFATSPIPTFGVTVTRAADNYNFLTSSIPFGAEYSIYGRLSTPHITNQMQAFSLTTGAVNKYIGFRPNTALRLAVFDVSSQVSIAGNNLTANVMMSAAARLKANDFAHSTNGAAVGTDTSGTLFAATQVRFGATQAASGGTFHIAKMMIVPRAWNNTELQTQSAVT